MSKCLQCEKETTNPKFCSRSCAATYNNVRYPKRGRLPDFHCKVCGIKIYKHSTYCRKHANTNNKNDWSKITYGEAVSKRSYQAHSRIRDLARRTYKDSNGPKKCCKCGYEKHFEVCHIKPINSFSSDTVISDINSLDNLVALCRNCHWEFDHGFLTL